MPDDLRVRELIEEILDSDLTPEDVCRNSPELLPDVRHGWERLRAIQAQLGLLFPEPGADEDPGPSSQESDLPDVPGYVIGSVLGRGGVGVVYKAVHERLQRTVALKMLLAGAFASRAERQRFAREAEVVASLRHPNVVQVFDIADLDGRPYFTMEFVEGGSLADLIAGTPRPTLWAADLVATLADTMSVAHRIGVIHRDLKPSNVLLTAEGTPKVCDFGLARRVEVGSSLTQSGAAVGTPSYMSPEQARGDSDAISRASDLYGLGAILYELLTGRPPFRAESAAETVYQVITQDPVPPSRLNAAVPPDLETICLKCLRKDPEHRYPDAEALAEDLRRFLQGDPIAARPENALGRIVRRVRRRPAFSAAVAVVALITVSLAIGGLWLATERARTARDFQADRAARAKASEDDLREMVHNLQNSSWSEAHAALERAKGRLGDQGPPELRRRIEQGASDLALVARLDAIRLGAAGSVGGQLFLERSDDDYARALQESGMGQVGDEPEAVASQVRASNVRNTLLIMLDDLAFHAKEPARQEWLLAVARLADDDPTGWRNRARDPATRRDKTSFARLVEAVPVADLSVPFLLAMADQLDSTDQALPPFLGRIQRSHPGDFWANFVLAENLRRRGNPSEAIRYYQAAMALRPGTGVVHDALGTCLSELSRFEESLEQHRQAIQIDPTAAQGHHNLAIALQGLRQYDQAIVHSRIAVGFRPEVASVHLWLGMALQATGKPSEAISEFRQAVLLDPKAEAARLYLRSALLGQRQAAEAQVVWRDVLASNPPKHDDWYGYTELCLFLGLEDEYVRARRSLLAKFGDSTDPYTAERTARSCLLRPLSEDELSRVVALGERAWGVDRSKYASVYPHFLFLHALAEYRQGRSDRAISLLQGDESRVLGPAPRLVLALAMNGSGRPAEARKTLASAVLSHDWRPGQVKDQDDWMYHTLRREAEAAILPDLPSFLEGKYRPQDNDERLALLGVCQFLNRPAASSQLYADAFAADSRLADDLRAGHRYNAARMAALAGSDLDRLTSEQARKRWRDQARQWLRADLAAWSRNLDDHPSTAPDATRKALNHWRDEPDLSALRATADPSSLLVDERKDCVAFWDEVAGVLARAGQAR